MHLLPSVAIQPNLELKTWPKQLLGSLPLVIMLPAGAYASHFSHFVLHSIPVSQILDLAKRV
jgi:hypothetical protein